MPEQKVLIIGTGGGLTSEAHTDGYQYIAPLTREYIEKHCPLQVDYDVLELFREDSIHITPEMWVSISDLIYKNFSAYSAFIIVHGTDTMAFTGAALSLFFQNLTKPILLIGGSHALSEEVSFGRELLTDALHVACNPATPPGVYAVSDGTVVAGDQICNAADFRGTILSANVEPVARIKKNTVIWRSDRPETRPTVEMKYLPTLDTHIAVQSIFPGFDPALLFQTLLVSKPHAFILRGYGSGCVPRHGDHSLLPFLREARDMGIPVVICSGSTAGTTYLSSFESGVPALSYEVIEANRLTYEMTVVKLMWALGQTRDTAQVAQIMKQDQTASTPAD